MIYGEASTTVTAPPAQVLDLVCDLERYKLADTKIRKVLGTRIDGDRIVVRFRSRLRGLPAPAVEQQIVRSGDERLDITSVPSWHSRLVRFSGSVSCERTTAGTRVVPAKSSTQPPRSGRCSSGSSVPGSPATSRRKSAALASCSTQLPPA